MLDYVQFMGLIMNDFTSYSERLAFEVLGRIGKPEDYPFCSIDGYQHGLDISRGNDENLDFDEMMARFQKTFSGMFKPSDGGDVLYSISSE